MRKTLLLLISIFGISSAMAQTTDELFKFSQYDFGGITARSAAMGGAFTSLGADLSSASINPAGLAMYSSSEFAFSTAANVGSSTTTYGGANKENSARFTINLPNIGAALKLGNTVLSITYNQLATYNSSTKATGNYEQFNSAARIWIDQAQGISSSVLGNANSAYELDPRLWNASMGYISYMYDPLSDNSYTLQDVIDAYDAIASTVEITTRGSLNETVLSGAYNFDNFLYIGGSIGFQNLYYEQVSTYSEYTKESSAFGVFNDTHISQSLLIEGFGVNFKVGATLRPVPWLRIGLAYHSPTWMSIKEVSSNSMISYFVNMDKPYYTSYLPDYPQTYLTQSPDRLLVGASMNISNIGIFSLDYQRTWYGSMRYNSSISSNDWRPGVLSTDIENNYASSMSDYELNSIISSSYQAVNTIKAGLELTPGNGVFFRLGYAYSSSPYTPVRSTYSPLTSRDEYGAINRWSGGLGYRTGDFNFDISYTCSSWKSLPSKFFDYVTNHSYDTGYNHDDGTYNIIYAGTEISSFENINQTNYNHNLIFTFSWRM